MARAEQADTKRPVTSQLSSASFRSATSYASFRSCRSIKSVASSNRASFRSVLSRENSYYSCADPDTDIDNVRTGLVNEGYQDNISFYSCNDVPENTNQQSIESEVAPRLRSVSDSVLHSFDMELWSKNNSEGDKGSQPASRFLSSLALLLAGVAVAASTFAQTLSPSLPPWVIIIFRSSLQLLLSICLLVVLRCSPLGPPGGRWRLLLTSLLSSFLLATIYLSVSRLEPRLTAAILMFTAPLVSILSSIINKEHVGLFRFLSLCVFIAGAVVITRPSHLFPSPNPNLPASQLHLDLAQHNIYGLPVQFTVQGLQPSHSTVDVAGVVACVASVVITSFLFILNRQSREARLCVVLFWTSLGSLVMGGIGLYTLGYSPHNREIFREGREVTDIPPDSANTTTTTSSTVTDHLPLIFPNRMFDGVNEWLVGTLISLLGIFATVMVIKALQYVEAGRAALIKTTEIITGYILVTSLSSLTSLDWLDVVGVVLVFLAVMAATIEEKLVDRKRWKWF